MLKHNEQLKMAINTGEKLKQRLSDMTTVFLGEANTETSGSTNRSTEQYRPLRF